MPLLIVVSALTVRLILLYTVYGDLRHGSAAVYGSVAIGMCSGMGLTYNVHEINSIKKISNNYCGNYLAFHSSKAREPFTEFLPGPAILLGFLWKIIPVFNFSPYLLLQVVLDSVLISLFYVVFSRFNIGFALITTLVMIGNLAVIKRTLMMGYDFWPQFCVLTTFIGVLLAAGHKRDKLILLAIGILTAVVLWFRDVTTLFPIFISVFFFIYYRRENAGYAMVVARISIYLLPIVLSLFLLSVFRYETTGNPRPTRSTFWHTFFAGVGQFSNPYQVTNTDESVWLFGKRINNDLNSYSLSDMYKLPDSPYEQTLKQQAMKFILNHPSLLIRNLFYRIAIMISPVLYRDGDFVPKSLAINLFPIGILLLPIWFFGMFTIHKQNKLLFWVSATVYLYFFSAFGWFYVVGRVILPFLFINTFVYLFGMQFVISYFYTRIVGTRL